MLNFTFSNIFRSRLSEPPGNIVLCLLFFGVQEHFLCIAVLHQFPKHKKTRLIAYPRCLLHIMSNYDYCILFFEFVYPLLYLEC